MCARPQLEDREAITTRDPAHPETRHEFAGVFQAVSSQSNVADPDRRPLIGFVHVVLHPVGETGAEVNLTRFPVRVPQATDD